VEGSSSFHRSSPDVFRAIAYIENGTARLVSRKENAHKSFPALTTGRPTIRRTAGPERFIYSLLRTAIYDYSGALFCQRGRDGQADSGRSPRNQSSSTCISVALCRPRDGLTLGCDHPLTPNRNGHFRMRIGLEKRVAGGNYPGLHTSCAGL
jgi:hypothetical protein